MIISDKLELCKLLYEVDDNAANELEILVDGFLDQYGQTNETKLDSIYDSKMKVFKSN